MPRNPVHRATSFAHLVGLGAPAAGKPSAEDEEEDDKKRDDARAEDDDDDSDDDKKRDDAKAEEGDDEDGAKAEDDDGDDEDEGDEKDPKARAAVRRHNTRCEAIFASRHATGRADIAAELAFRSNLSAKQAIAILAKLPRASASGDLSDRMASLGSLRTSATGTAPTSGRQAIASAWDRAAEKAGVKRR